MLHGCKMSLALLVAASSAMGATGLARAADVYAGDAYAPAPKVEAAFRLLDEVRVGLLAVEPLDGDEHQFGVNGELLTSRLPVASGNRLVDFVFGPRLHVGASTTFGNAPEYGYAGFTWTVPVTDALFLEAALGGAVNTGGDDGALGCTWTFREAAAIGYEFDANWSVLVGIEHLSHADLCGDRNGGLTNVAAKVGYRF